MADLKLVGAVAIKVRPNAKGFKKETEDQVRDQLKTVKAEVKVKVKGDTSELASDLEKAEKAIEKQTFSMKVDLDYDSVHKAELALEKAIKGLAAHKISVELDEEGIAQAQGQIAELMDNAQIEMTFVDDVKGYEAVLAKIAAIRRQKLEVPIEFGFSEAELREKEQEMLALLAEAAVINVSYNNDRASIERSLAQIKAEQDKIQAVEFDVHIDPQSLDTAQQLLEAVLSRTPVELEVNYQDQGSLKAVRDRLKAMLVELGSEKLEIQFNEQSIQEQLDRINSMIQEEIQEVAADPTTLKLNYNINRSSLTRAIGLIDAELDKLRQLTIEPALNEAELEAAKKKLQDELGRQPVELTINYSDQASLKAARARLQSMLNETIGQKIDITMDEEAIRAELQKVNDLIDDEIPKEKKVDIPVEPTGLEILARQLQWASRARRVPFYVVIDEKSVAVAEGILRSLAGVNTLQALGRGLEGIITKFDTFSLKAGAWSGAIGGLVDTLVYMTSALFTVADGMASVVGLTATLPAGMSALAAAVFINVMAFQDFKKALDGDAEAMAALPPAAQSAVRALDGVYEAIQKPVQQAFWETAGEGLQGFVDNILPQFKNGLIKSAAGAGIFFNNIVSGLNDIAISGDLERMFDNLDAMFRATGEAAAPAIEAFNILGLRGSEFLPRFGQWILDITTQFRNWIVEADRLGNINTWIEQGITSLQDMWYASGAIIDQFKAIARAAGLVGQNGLDDFRHNMRGIADTMLAEPWQTKMGTIFDGARNGARELSSGLGDLGTMALDSSGYVSNLLLLLGQLGGDFFSGVSKTLGNFKFQEGTLDSIRGMSEMIREVEPSFDRLGTVMGTMGTIAGQVFRELSPVINSVSGILSDVVAKLEGNLSDIVPTLMTLSNNLINFARGPIELVVDGLNAFLGILLSMPTPLRNAAVAFGVFLLLRNQFGAFASSLSGLWTSMTTSVVKGTANIERATASLNDNVMNGVPTSFRRMADGSIREVNRFGTLVGTGMTAADKHVQSFKPGATVPTRLAAMNTTSATHMRRFQDIFANSVTTASAAFGAFVPDKQLNPALVAVTRNTAAQMSSLAGTVGRGVDNMVASIGRFQPASIGERLGRVASGIPAVVGRINGALGLIGGLPGLALGLIGVMISNMGANAAEAAANIDVLRDSLDKVTGDATISTLANVAGRITEIDEAGDSFENFWRGVVNNSKAGNETLKTLGVQVSSVAKIITGSRAEYDKFIGSLRDLGAVNNLKAVGDIMNGLTVSKASLFTGSDTSSPGDDAAGGQQDRQLELLKRAAEAAKSLKLDPKIFSDPQMKASILNLTGEIDEQRRRFELAQIAVQIYGDRLGIGAIKGQQMAAAMATIRDTSLDATSKIDAMNRAMQLLNDGGLSEQDAAIKKADDLARIAENAKNLAGSIAESRGTLFKEGTNLLNDQNVAARGLFKLMQEGSDNVKIAAKAAYDAAIANGDTAAVAMGKAREAIKAGDQDLQTIADNAGIAVDELKGQWGSFFNEKWVLEASIAGTSEQFKTAIAEAQRMGIDFSLEEFEAWLMANKDPAAVSADEITAYLNDYALKKFTATLDALPAPAQAMIAQVLGEANNFAAGNYRAVLDAFNNASPGVQSALMEISRVTDPKWQAMLFAGLDQGSLSWVEYQLNYLARNRTMNVNVTTTDIARDEALANAPRQQRYGAILDQFGRGMKGFNPEYVKHFANGGIENHVAQIQRAGGPVRIWAEPETKAEAYIPYAQAKRPRSLRILRQVARDFGYDLSKGAHYADGAIVGNRTTRTSHMSADVHIGTMVTTDMDAAVRKLNQTRRDALAVAGIR